MTTGRASELPFGFMTHLNNGGIPNHGFTHWWTMFHPRQLLVHAQLLKGDHDCRLIMRGRRVSMFLEGFSNT